MKPEEFEQVLTELGWKQADFCRKTGVDKNTPSRWANGKSTIPPWVSAYLGAMLEIKRLHSTYVSPKGE